MCRAKDIHISLQHSVDCPVLGRLGRGDRRMFLSTAALTFGLSLALLVSASTQDYGLDDVPLSDQPAPTPPPLAVNELYPSLSWGSVAVNITSTGSQRRSRSKTRLGRPDVRQSVSGRQIWVRLFLIRPS
jgi:hypothetical protein